jgi:hypothetical protein
MPASGEKIFNITSTTVKTNTVTVYLRTAEGDVFIGDAGIEFIPGQANVGMSEIAAEVVDSNHNVIPGTSVRNGE